MHCPNGAGAVMLATEVVQIAVVALRMELAALYGGRLRGVYLFGSYARHEQEEESDLDVLIILSYIDRYADEIARTGQLVSDLSLAFDVSVSLVFLSETTWRAGESPFVRNVRAEAIAT